MNVLSFMRALLSRGDWVYTLSLLVPFVVYILVLKALDTASLPGDDYGIARTLNLMWSDIFFGFGYTLFWLGFFGAVRSRGLLRWSVVVLFHMTTILVIVMTTCAHEYFQLTGTTLSYGTLAEWLPKLSEIQPILLNGGVSSWIWVLLFFALLYATLGPWLVTRAVGWQHRGSRRSTEGRSKIFLPSFLGLGLLALGFGVLSLLVGSSLVGATTSLARDPFVNVVLTGVQEVIANEDYEYAHPDVKFPAVDGRVVQTPSTQKRNVVLIHLESTRERSVTPYNHELDTTPFLDELAKKSSLLAERAYVVVPRSSKASVAVNCGVDPPLYQGPEFELGNLPSPCLAGLLKGHGYRTAFFQSSSETMDQYWTMAKNLGYGEYYPSESMDTKGYEATNYISYEDDIMLKPSEEWLKVNGDKPFMIQYLTGTGHDDYRCLDTRHGSEEFSKNDLLNRYLNCLRLQDIFLKSLIGQYKELGLYDNTIFVIYGDHGEGFGEHGRLTHGDTIWDEGLKIPLIIHAPGMFESSQRVKGLSNETDIVPTVLEMLGYELQGGKYPGYSLLHEPPKDRTLRISCISELKCLASIKGNEKYIYHYDNQPEEVFDLSADPLEEHNLADEYSKEDLDKRRKDILAWISSIDTQYYGYESLTADDQEDSWQQVSRTGGQPKGATVEVGEPLTVGDVEWTVTSVYPTDTLISSVDGGTKRGNFIVLDFQLKNNGTEGLTLNSKSLALVDDSGRRFEFDTNTFLYLDSIRKLPS